MTSRAAQNVARKQIIDEIIDSLETDEGGGYQMQAQRAIREQEVKA